jgi:hypothetical protein
MARNIMDTLAVSLPPDEAAALLAGVYTTLVVFEPAENVIRYSGRMLIHSLGFPDEDEEVKANCRLILNKLGFTEETFPAYCIQGWITVKGLKLYNEDTFAEDANLHGCGESLMLYQAQNATPGAQTWGIMLKDPFIIDPPVVDVIPPAGIDRGDLWLPDNPFQMEAFKLALSSVVEREEDEAIAAEE